MVLRTTRAWRFLSAHEERVRAAHELTETAIRQHVEDVEAWYIDQRAKLEPDAPEHEHEHVDFLYAEQKADADYFYPQILRQSVFFSSYGGFERFMDLLCLEARENMGLSLSHKDLRDRGIQRARAYLVKVAEIDVPETADWNAILGHRDLRHALVHAAGDLTESSRLKHLKQLEGTVGTFRIAADLKRTELLREFNLRFLDHVRSFAAQLEERWPG